MFLWVTPAPPFGTMLLRPLGTCKNIKNYFCRVRRAPAAVPTQSDCKTVLQIYFSLFGFTMSGFLRWNRRVEKVIAALGFLYARKRHIGFGRKRHSCTHGRVTHDRQYRPTPHAPQLGEGTLYLKKLLRRAQACPHPNPQA